MSYSWRAEHVVLKWQSKQLMVNTETKDHFTFKFEPITVLWEGQFLQIEMF
jgi:hypothetical protein